MKNIFVFASLVLCQLLSIEIAAQVTPAAYSSGIPINYVRAWDAVKPETNPNNITSAAEPSDFRMTTLYVDGLGRPLQTVIKKGSLVTSTGTTADLVSSVVYDQFGREQSTYLPFVANNTGGNTSIADGLFKMNPFQQQAAFYASGNTNGPLYNQNETWFYGQTIFEASPLNRPIEIYAPGNSWSGTSTQTTESNRRAVKMKYYINTVTDDVKKWNVTNVTNGWGTYAINGYYPAGELYKNITIDEANKQVIEFKDKEGKVILKKVQLTATADDGAGSGYPGWLCTYYIYDDLGQLRCVVQPEGVKWLSQNSWVFDYSPSGLGAEQCFRYEYDARGRMIMKKVPGAGDVYMVYDQRDRLVMTQDAKLRADNKWLVTLYDDLNRPVQTGLLLNTWNNKTFLQHQQAATPNPLPTSFTAYPFTSGTTPSGTYWEYLTKTGYDSYMTIPGASGLNNTISTTYINSTYGFFTTYNASPEYAQQIPATASTKTKGLVTWTETKVLGTSTYLYTVMIYDDKGRAVQVKSKNITGGTDIVTTQYSWSGQPLVSVQEQVKSGSPSQTTVIVTKLIYDALGRLVQTDKKIKNTNVNSNNLAPSYTTISKNEYDALGQLKKKRVGSKKDASNNYITPWQPIEDLTYDYNIRGWMLGMNRAYIGTQGQSGTTRFGFELGYDKQTNSAGDNFTNAQYNGNITGMIWKSDGDDVRRKYDFSYDAANRLMQGLFKQDNGGSTWNNTSMDYTIKMGDGSNPDLAYDYNGNIKGMIQYGWKITAPTSAIDNMAYTYNTNSNKLLKVVDAVPPPSGGAGGGLGDFKDGSNGSGNDYTYDVNGNLTLDNNKAISSITYNHLNLPLVITVTGKGTITYTYDAAGGKQKKVTSETGATVAYNGTNYTNVTITTTTSYFGGSVFETKAYSNGTVNAGLGYTDRLQFIAHEEGRIRFKYENNTLHYDYMLKDHLGNVRMILTEENKSDAYTTLSFEDAQVTNQNAEWENASGASINVGGVRTASVSGFNSATGNGSWVRMIKRSTGAIGATKLVKVMAGDRIHAKVDYYYTTTNSATNNSGANPLTSFVNGLTSAFSVNTQVGALIKNDASTVTTQLSGNSNFTTAINPSPNTSGSNQAPKAYLNILFFNEQFQFDANSSVVVKVAYTTSKASLDKTFSNALTAQKNGYVYVYFSNESETNVYFDNFIFTHERGSLTEETHYYPFGLTMTGISSKAVSFGSPQNKYKYNGYEENKDLDINLYETFYRSHDPQLGRFWQVDPKASFELESYSPYSAMRNNPILRNDLFGDKDTTFNNKTDKPINVKRGTETPVFIYNKDGTVKRDENGNEVLAPNAKAAYNCHSYAWENSQGDPSDPSNARLVAKGVTKWDEDPSNNMNGYTQLGSSDPNKAGDRVIYYSDKNGNGRYDPGEHVEHSAIVTQVDKRGNTTLVIGKMGQNGISENHPNAPNYYSVDVNGAPTSRAYFRASSSQQTSLPSIQLVKPTGIIPPTYINKTFVSRDQIIK